MLRHVLSDMTSRAVYSTIQDERDLLSEQRDFRLVFLFFLCALLLVICCSSVMYCFRLNKMYNFSRSFLVYHEVIKPKCVQVFNKVVQTLC